MGQETQSCPQDYLWKVGMDSLFYLPTEPRKGGFCKYYNKPMTRFHDDPSPQMEEKICGKVEHPEKRQHKCSNIMSKDCYMMVGVLYTQQYVLPNSSFQYQA